MKKLYTGISLLLLLGTSAYAQKTIGLGVNLVNPASSTTIPVGMTFTQDVVITNNGPGAIAPGDSLFYVDPTISSGAYFRVGYTKAVGDTIQLHKSLAFTASSAGGSYNYCVVAVMSNGSTIIPDTTNWRDCNTIMITGGTGIGEVIAKEEAVTSQMTVSPNPSLSKVTFDYVAKNNSDVVANVFDVAGRKVITNTFNQVYNGQNGFGLDISGLNAGVYFVEIRQEGYRSIGKVVKQ